MKVPEAPTIRDGGSRAVTPSLAPGPHFNIFSHHLARGLRALKNYF